MTEKKPGGGILLVAALPILVDNGFLGGRELGALGSVGESFRAACLDDGLWSSLCRSRWPCTADVPPQALGRGGYRDWYRRRVPGIDRDRNGFGAGGPRWWSCKREMPDPDLDRDDILFLVDVSLAGMPLLSRALRRDELGVLFDEGCVDIQLDAPADLGTCRPIESSDDDSDDDDIFFDLSEEYGSKFDGLIQIVHRRTGEACSALNGGTVCVPARGEPVTVNNESNARALVGTLEFTQDEVRSLPLKSSANYLLERIIGSRLQIGQLGNDFCKILRVDTHFQLPEFCFNIEIIPHGTPLRMGDDSAEYCHHQIDAKLELVRASIVRVRIKFSMFLPLWYQTDAGAFPWTDELFGRKETVKHKVTILHLLDHLDCSNG